MTFKKERSDLSLKNLQVPIGDYMNRYNFFPRLIGSLNCFNNVFWFFVQFVYLLDRTRRRFEALLTKVWDRTTIPNVNTYTVFFYNNYYFFI